MKPVLLLPPPKDGPAAVAQDKADPPAAAQDKDGPAAPARDKDGPPAHAQDEDKLNLNFEIPICMQLII